MKIHELSPAPNSKKEPRRLGRGIGSGLGKTSGKEARASGQEAAAASVSVSKAVRCLLRADCLKRASITLGKSLFHRQSRSARVFEDGAVVNAEVLLEKGILSKIEPYGLKVLSDGELTKKLTVQAKKFSKSAVEKIEKIGGKVEVL